MQKMENADENPCPLVLLSADTINLKHIKDIPEIVCWSILLTDDMVARVSSSAKV